VPESHRRLTFAYYSFDFKCFDAVVERALMWIAGYNAKNNFTPDGIAVYFVTRNGKRAAGPYAGKGAGTRSTLSIAGHKVNRDSVGGEVILRVVSSNPHQCTFDDSVKAFEIKRVIRESQTSMRLWHVLWICKSTALAIPRPSGKWGVVNEWVQANGGIASWNQTPEIELEPEWGALCLSGSPHPRFCSKWMMNFVQSESPALSASSLAELGA
jgi:hypothetical protein